MRKGIIKDLAWTILVIFAVVYLLVYIEVPLVWLFIHVYKDILHMSDTQLMFAGALAWICVMIIIVFLEKDKRDKNKKVHYRKF